MIHVVGRGVSTFISYADLPPILEVEPPTNTDFVCWRKRWKKNNKQAPEFWVEFYLQKFLQALSVAELYTWGQLVRVIKFALSQAAVQGLRSVFLEAKYSRSAFLNESGESCVEFQGWRSLVGWRAIRTIKRTRSLLTNKLQLLRVVYRIYV